MTIRPLFVPFALAAVNCPNCMVQDMLAIRPGLANASAI